MKKTFITAALLSVAAPSLVAGKLTMEEHTMQAVLQMQEAKEKLGGPVGGSIVTVGDDVQCDFRLGTSRIQDAIDAGNDEIRIADSTYEENLLIDDISVILKGGYASCADAANDVTNNSKQTISGVPGAGAATIIIQGNTQRNTVTLERLTIDGGTSSGFLQGGGVFTITADLALNINNSTISFNEGSAGGGLGVFAGNTDVVLFNTIVASNTSDTSGGGIWCNGSNSSIFYNDDGGLSGVFNNVASNGDGGGILIEAGCVLTSYIGRPYPVGFLDLRGIVSNTATGNGGGLAVRSGGTAFLNGGLFCFFFCLGDNTRPANIDFNTADSDGNNDGFGGGIYATDPNTTVNLLNTYISDNEAQSGGGIAVENQANLVMRSSYVFGTCWNPGSCSQLSNNQSAQTGFPTRGGGLYATSGAVVDISNTEFRNNRADFGTAMYTLAEVADATVTNLDVEGSLIVNNGDDANTDWSDIDTIRINGGEVLLDYNTIADNDVGIGGANINNTGSVEIFSSIIHNTDGALVYRGDVQPNTTLPYECLMVNETGSLPVEPEIVADDPEFIDRANGDFHLNAAISPAIDFCTTLNASTPDFNDSDNEARGFDDPLATNFQGPYDVGYDETYQNDIIFEDDFDG